MENQENFIANFVSEIDKCLLGKKRDTYNIINFAAINSSFEAAKYYCDMMTLAANYSNNFDLLSHALDIRTLDGLVLEFGVNSGGTVNHISKLVSQTVFGFDVFTGLPETWRTGFSKGLFAQKELPEVNDNVNLVVGLFEDTLDAFLEAHKGCISFLHVDCDLYSATKTIFDKLGNRIEPGTVIVFDEYFNYPGWQNHEFKAFQEFVKYRNIKYHYDSFVADHQQVCVVID